MTPRNFVTIIATACLASCASVVRLPQDVRVDADHRPRVVWHQMDSHLDKPGLELVGEDGKAHLISIESVFTPDVVEALGPPRGDLLQTFTSPSGDTIVVHEIASESSPSEHIAIFSRLPSDEWRVRSVFPPHSPGPVYGYYGVTKGVDDTYLYYHFSDGKLCRIRLESLTERPVKHAG